jgi:hypothetical protein
MDSDDIPVVNILRRQRSETTLPAPAPSNAPNVAVTHNAVEMKAKSGKVWSSSPPVIHRRQAQDVIHDRPGAKRGSQKPTVSEVYQLYVTEEILDIVIRETNREGRRVCSKWNDDHPDKLQSSLRP